MTKLSRHGRNWLLSLTVFLALTSVVAAIGVAAFSGGAQAAAGKTRVYFIGADEVAWDYAPTDINQMTGDPFGDKESVYYVRGPGRIGRVHTKAVYREYTDETFAKLKPRPPQWQHLGILGPVVHAEVGDTIEIHFKNNLPFPASVHPHGVFYLKDSEGAPYNDTTQGKDKADDAVPPGGTHMYKWQVPERSGPGPMDPNSMIWTYHSHTDEVADTNAGLIGPMIITRKGMANPDGSPSDVDQELVVLFTVFNENASQFLDQDIKKSIDSKFLEKTPADDLKADDEFVESNLMHTMNGFGYGNLQGLDLHQGWRVRWYVIGMGTEVDLHTPHWHGNTLLYQGMRTDMTDLLPMTMKVLDMVPDNLGVWMFHCHVNDHLEAGMIGTYGVFP